MSPRSAIRPYWLSAPALMLYVAMFLIPMVMTFLLSFYARQEWQKLRERNEALDCRVYARAAAWILGADRWDEATWQRLEEQAGVETRQQITPTDAAAPGSETDSASVTKAGTPTTPRRKRRAYTPKFMRD